MKCVFYYKNLIIFDKIIMICVNILNLIIILVFKGS